MRYEFKVVIIGSVAVGKTALTNRLNYNQFEEEYQATIGAGYTPYRAKCDGSEVELQIWDTAGMERYKSLGPVYYRDAVAAMIVYDQGDQESANAVEKWLEAFRNTVKTPTTIFIVGNKDDIEEKVVDNDAMMRFAEENGFDFFLTSAKTGKNVVSMFQLLAKKLVDSKNREPKIATERPSLTAHQNNTNSLNNCC